MKEQFGILDNGTARKLRRNIDMSLELLRRIDGKSSIDDPTKGEILKMNNANSLCDKHELDWPLKRGVIRLRGVLKQFSKPL